MVYFVYIWTNIFYLIQFTGQLFVFISQKDFLSLVLLFVLGFKLLPLALAGKETRKGQRQTQTVKLLKLIFIP